MVVYNLDETPDFFITPANMEDEFVYTVALIKGEDNWKPIRSIDLRNDKLIIYGTEIKESMFKRLYESLVIKMQTVIFVNCKGACYVYLGGKFYRTIYNVIFDWSSFGVIVPNSMNDLLKKRVEELEKAVEKSNKEGELTRIEVEGRINEINELKRVQNELSLELQKAYEKVGLNNSELERYKIELELHTKESDEVLDELRRCKEGKAKTEVELQKMSSQHSSEIFTFKKVNDDLEKKSKLLENELLVVRSELHATKDQLDLSRRNAKELEEQLCMAKEELSTTQSELRYTKDQLSSSNENVKRVEDQLCAVNKEFSSIQSELKKTRDQLLSEISTSNKRNYDQLSLALSELQSIKNQLNSYEKNIKELEEQLSNFKIKYEDTMIQLETSKKEVQELKDQIELHDKEQCLMHKMWSNCFSIFKRN